MRVLIADKDPHDLEALRAELASPDVEVIEARDGPEALELARRRRPDVVVLAASLGRMGGLAVSRELKMDAHRPGGQPPPPVIVLLEREADAWLARWARCDAYLTKPLAPQEVAALARELAAAGPQSRAAG